jgi:peptidoglycan LD-endopeptidase LytH
MTTNNYLDSLLQQYQNQLQSVVPFNPDTEKLLLLDFTESNFELTPEIVNDTDAFSQYIDKKLATAGAIYGIGGYNEHRTVYARSEVFDTSDEPRRLHLGTDIWGAAGTPVFAALDGVVHSLGNNNRFGDYGATIILQHQLGGFVFHSLYGHLSLASINALEKNQKIAAGSQIASFGIAEENGNWPPHLHLQLIIDMQGMSGDYPGVCKFSERETYLSNCPNPDLLLNLERFII